MDTSEIRVNEENYNDYDLSEIEYGYVNSPMFRRSLDLSVDLDKFFDTHLNSKHDWAGKYHSWLKSYGLEPETENGWWSRAAFNPLNLQCFILDYTDSDFSDRLAVLNACRPRGNIFEVKAKREYNNVLDMLIAAEKLI